MIGMTVYDTTMGTTVANLGMTDVRFPRPVFHGDTLHATTKVISLRESKSRPQAGIVEFEHHALNQNDEIVGSCRAPRLHAQVARLMRSMLFVPGDSPRKFEKASKSKASALILDLEDSVCPTRRTRHAD